MPRKRWPPTTIIMVILLLLGILIILAVRPDQAEITEEVLELKDSDEEAYLDFIAENLVTGGPPKDGIPSIDNPKYLTAEEANLDDNAPVFGVNYGGKILAFPQDIMYWHEIVNEETETGKFSVTYCPLTGSVIGYLDHELGVSGALYNSNLVMYDRKTDSYIPQILGKGITEKYKGTSLETFPVEVTTWSKWKTLHPETLVLSRDTGFSRDYDDNPYPGYDQLLRVWFPVAAEDDRFHSKLIVHGIVKNGKTYTVLKESLRETLTHEGMTITWNEDLDTVNVEGADSNFDVYWFAWAAYHPDTVVING